MNAATLPLVTDAASDPEVESSIRNDPADALAQAFPALENLMAGCNYRAAKALQERLVKAVRDSSSCAICQQLFNGEDVIYLEQVATGSYVTGGEMSARTPVCNRCKKRDFYAPSPCEQCGRRVALEIPSSHFWAMIRGGQIRSRHGRILCSRRCRWLLNGRDRSARSARFRLKDCVTCGERFEATRRDAVTCSPACRQKAYRRRKGGGS
jgi:hypothetical protein